MLKKCWNRNTKIKLQACPNLHRWWGSPYH